MKKLLLSSTMILSFSTLINASSHAGMFSHHNGIKGAHGGVHRAMAVAPSVGGAVVNADDASMSFRVIPVAGNGDCAFTSIGKSREEVVAALQGFVRDSDDLHQTFLTNRSTLHNRVAGLSVGSSNISQVLSDVADFINNASGLYNHEVTSDTGEAIPKASTLALNALNEFNALLLSGNVAQSDFISARLLLQSRINNMYYERYEAFKVALIEELKDSGVNANTLNNKAGLLQGISRAFAVNNGPSSWLPMGLIFGVTDRLGLNLAVWSSRDTSAGTIKLLQGNSSDILHPLVTHIVWTGGHFDKLVPIIKN